MKVLVTGARGQLGQDVLERLRVLRIPCVGVGREDFDLTDQDAVMRAVCATRPTAIIHCAAYTNVDKAESEPALCCRVNGLGTLNLARAALRVGAKLMYISSDFVFSGEGDQPFLSTQRPAPVNVYGLSKLQGEEAVTSLMSRYFIVRISWLFSPRGRNFVRSIVDLGSQKREISVVDDQIGSPTYSPDLARLLCEMIQTNRYGVYHATNEGECSRYAFARAIIRRAGLPCRVRPIASTQFDAKARRPANSRLDKESLDLASFPRLPGWEDALDRCLQSMRIIASQRQSL